MTLFYDKNVKITKSISKYFYKEIEIITTIIY